MGGDWDGKTTAQFFGVMDPPAEKKARLHFGSLEEQERMRLQTGGSSFSSAVREGILSGNINIAPAGEVCACTTANVIHCKTTAMRVFFVHK